jgi:SAM-dependent methyltransferase
MTGVRQRLEYYTGVHPQDHFSAVSTHYAASRPRYPKALYQWLAGISPARDCAWDCACGSGQASGDLAEYFAHVVATDLSAQQIREAAPHPRIDYRVAVAESSGLSAGSIDLVIVAQALHWFQCEPFYTEVDRVLRPDGVLAVWSYGTGAIDLESVNSVFQDFYHNVVGEYWPPERKIVEVGYQSLPFPQPELSAPRLTMECDWSLEALIGYVRSWSATARYINVRGSDPVPDFQRNMLQCWGDPSIRRRICWPLSIRAARRNPKAH